MDFTPLVSPAVTPLDTNFQYPESALVGDNFSPLTSPAIEARNHAAQSSAFETMRNSDTSETTSPIDLGANMPVSGSVPAKKPRRKTLPTQKNPARSVKQSPAMKPQSRKKQTMSTTIPQREVSGIIEEASKNTAGKAATTPRSSAKLPLPYTHDSSETESISPEPLSEILMPPPATPKSSTASQSPALSAKHPTSNSAPTSSMPEEPATPASLMRIRKEARRSVTSRQGSSGLKEQASLAEMDAAGAMEDITLPEPAKAAKPALTPINTVEANDEQITPTLSGQKTPKCGATSAPLTATSSVFPSPQLNALVSPGGTNSGKGAQSKNNLRERKKRTSSSSVQVSPALRPRISPSIKPLLPEGGKLPDFIVVSWRSTLNVRWANSPKQQASLRKHQLCCWLLNPTIKISSKAPICPGFRTRKPFRRTSHPSALHTNSPSKVVGTASIRRCKRLLLYFLHQRPV